MKFVVLTLAGRRQEWLNAVTESYVKKINYWLPLELLEIKPTRLARKSSHEVNTQKVFQESKKILAQIKKDDFVVLCDEKGVSLDSKAFAKRLETMRESQKKPQAKRVLFVLGGAYGVSDDVRQRADWIWSFSQMTFNHLISQVVLLEQIYRGMTICKGVPYHNE